MDSFVQKMKANAANIKGSLTSLTLPLLQLQSAFYAALRLTEEKRSSVLDKSAPVFLSPKVSLFY